LITTADGKLLGTITKYDTQGRAVKTERVQGAEVTINASGDAVLTATGTVRSTSQTIYNAKGQVARTIAPDGQITDYEYDSLGRPIATVGYAVRADQVGLTGSQFDGKLVRLRSETHYDAQGRVSHDVANLIQIDNAVGPPIIISTGAVTTTYGYDAAGQRVSTTTTGGSGAAALTTVTSATFDPFGRQQSETDAAANVRAFEYDAMDRLSAVVLPAVPNPACGSLAEPCLPADFANAALANPRYEYGYDAQGNQTLIRDPLGHETRFTFDEHGRQTSRTLPLGFGADGKLGTTDDAVGWTPSSVFPTSDAERFPFTEYFAYDDRGRQQLHVSFEGVVKQSVYDHASGRLAEQRFFASLAAYNNAFGSPNEIWSHSFDAFGREVYVVASLRDANGNHVVQRTESTAYDADGRLLSVASPEGIVAYSYDALGRKTATKVFASGANLATATPEYATSYTYDPLGRLKSVVGDRDSLSTLDAPFSTSYAYDLLGNHDLQTTPDGVITDYVYDALFRLDKQTAYQPDANTPDVFTDNPKLAEFDYTVRADGKRTDATETFWLHGQPNTNVLHWDYDAAGRLIDEVFNHYDDTRDFTAHYNFDLTGNRLRKTTSAPLNSTDAVFYLYDANDRLLTESLDSDNDGTPDQTTSYTWTATQQTSKSVTRPTSAFPLHTSNFTYNLQGRLSGIELREYNTAGQLTRSQMLTYAYDPDGIRVSARDATDANGDGVLDSRTKTEYLIDSHNFTGYQQILQETTTNADTGELIQRIVYAIGLDHISQTTFTPSGPTAGETLVFHLDGHGSTRILTDLAGALATVAGVAQLFHYDAYGNPVGFNPTTAATSFLYNNEQLDPATSLYNFRARPYDPRIGRLLGLDPFFGRLMEPQGFHKHAFVHGDPISGIDPSGEEFSLSASLTNVSVRLSLAARQVVAVARPLVQLQRYSRILSFASRVQRFFWDPRKFRTIGRAYWNARGGAAGRSLHHWLLPQRATWIPQGLRNAGFNLLNMPRVLRGPLGLNQWMGFALRWGGRRMIVAVMVENGIRIAIPLAAYSSYSVGRFVGAELSNEVFDVGEDVQAIPLNLSAEDQRELDASAAKMFEQLELSEENDNILPTLF